MFDNKIYIAFVKQDIIYGKFACWLTDGPYHHTLTFWYDDNLKEYVGIEATPCGGIKIHSLDNILSKYNKNIEVYACGSLTKDMLSFMKGTIGYKYDLSLLLKDLFVLLVYKAFKVLFKPKKKNTKSFICSEWVTTFLQKLFPFEFSGLVPHLTSPEALRQELKRSKYFYQVRLTD